MKRDLVGRLLAECNESRRVMVDNVLADLLPPLHEWPEHHLRMLLAPHLGEKGVTVMKQQGNGVITSQTFSRMDFICFLLGNALPPGTIVDWIIAQPGYLDHSRSAIDVAGILQKHADGKLSQKRYFDMTDRCTKELVTPPMASDTTGVRIAIPDLELNTYTITYFPPGREYWTDAIKRLHAYAKELPR
ncbi:MAG: hypothetical protein CMO41_04560 [Verrucomicrobiales bacterium]|nr:hypothetical protein [Verrucomicrobiales bacterium]|tara:strand:+ start:2358 stop:2924 length:567 start_codon:yes stop_codon:yes gene_type:complete